MDAAILAEGREPHSKRIRLYGCSDLVHDFQQETSSILDAATILIRSQTRTVFEKLVHQMSVCAPDFYSVEARFHGIDRCVPKIRNDPRDLFRAEHTRRFDRHLLKIGRKTRQVRRNGGRRERWSSIGHERRAGISAIVLDLHDLQPAICSEV
jgi:hypothetical protein